MTDEELKKLLGDPTPSEEESKILHHVRSLVRQSRSRMKRYYDRWDSYNQTYRATRLQDEADRRATERGEPGKMTIPITYAQVQTFVAFLFGMYTQKPTYFEFEATATDKAVLLKDCEAVVQRDLMHSNYELVLYQFLLYFCRCGVGIFKTTWAERYDDVTTTTQAAAPVLGGPGESMLPVTTTTRVPVSQGNRVICVSPYKIIPDTRLPMSRFQEGEFIASEDEFSDTSLRTRQANGELVGVEHIPDHSLDGIEDYGIFRYYCAQFDEFAKDPGSITKKTKVCTEVQISLIPSEYKMTDAPDSKSLGPEKYPVKYIVEYANDARVLKWRRMNYEHGMFTYAISEYSPDLDNFANPGLAEAIDDLQRTLSWFVNSRVTSVRKVVYNQFVVDPSGLEIKDFEDRNPLIRLKPAAYRSGPDKWIKQLDVQDVTAGHIKDVMVLKQLIEYCSGVNENATGQYAQGRRSASESKAVNTGATMRLKVPAVIAYSTALRPLVMMMVETSRQSLSFEMYQKIVGANADQAAYEQFRNGGQRINEDDVTPLDTTSPSEKIGQANALQEVLLGLLQAPQTIGLMGYGPDSLRYLFEQILALRGIPIPPRSVMPFPYDASPQVMPAPGAPALPPGPAGQAAPPIGQLQAPAPPQAA